MLPGASSQRSQVDPSAGAFEAAVVELVVPKPAEQWVFWGVQGCQIALYETDMDLLGI